MKFCGFSICCCRLLKGVHFLFESHTAEEYVMTDTLRSLCVWVKVWSVISRSQRNLAFHRLWRFNMNIKKPECVMALTCKHASPIFEGNWVLICMSVFIWLCYTVSIFQRAVCSSWCTFSSAWWAHSRRGWANAPYKMSNPTT